MKKIISFLIVFIGVIFLAGCFNSNEKVITRCTLENDQSSSGYVLNSNYSIYSTNGVVTSVRTKEVVTSDNNTILEYFKKTLNDEYTSASNTYGGYDFDVSIKDNTVVSTVTIDYNKMDLKKFISDNSSMKAYVNKDNKLTLEGAKKIYESFGATCK